MRRDALLFGESQSRIIVSLSESMLEALRGLAAGERVPLQVIGRVGGIDFRMACQQNSGEMTPVIVQPVEKIRQIWEDSLPQLLKEGAS
jgi:phosphoribosylformylglycinamidine synthase